MTGIDNFISAMLRIILGRISLSIITLATSGVGTTHVLTPFASVPGDPGI